MQALPSVAHQFGHAAGVKDEGTHHFVQFEEKVFLLLGQLLGLVPHLSGVQKVGGDLDVARCHLVDPLRNRDGGTAAAAAAHRRVPAGRAAGGELRRDRRGHARRFIPHSRRGRLGVTQRVL